MDVSELMTSLLLATIAVSPAAATDWHVYCLNERVNLSCEASHEVIMVTRAEYGRMDEDRCISYEYSNNRCSVDVTSYVDGKCSGRRTCQLNVRDVMDVAQPCPKDLISNLRLKYHCQPVIVGRPEHCVSQFHSPVEGPSGYISSMSLDGMVGTRDCPWRIRMQPGQKVNLTIFDFNFQSHRIENEPSCQISIEMVETDDAETSKFSLCPRVSRTREIISRSNQIDINFTVDRQKRHGDHYLIHFQAVGCADLAVPGNAYATVEAVGTLRVRCNHTQETWFITCKDRQWIGELGNCTAIGGPISPAGQSDRLVPIGLVLAVLIGVALGVVGGVMLLGFVFVCRKRCGRPRPATNEHYCSHRTAGGTLLYDTMSESRCLAARPRDDRTCVTYIDGSLRHPGDNGHDIVLCAADIKQDGLSTDGLCRSDKCLYDTRATNVIVNCPAADMPAHLVTGGNADCERCNSST